MNDSPPLGGNGPAAQVHTGHGTQNNYTFFSNGDADPRRLADSSQGKAPRAVAEDELKWLRHRFIHPVGYTTAYDVLEERHTVLVDGSPGSGRRATARVLLCSLPRKEGRFLELLPYREAEEEWLDPQQVGEADQLLLDLSGRDEQDWPHVEARLSGFRKVVRDRRAHLAVVLPHRVGRLLSPEYGALRVEISRPPRHRLEHDLIKRRLRLAGLDATVADPLPARLRQHLDQRPPLREVADLAHLLCEAGRSAGPGESFLHWCEAAIAAVTDCGPDVVDLLKRLRRAPHRALLLSAAMLHGARADTVHLAATRLLADVSHPENTTSLLERQGLGGRLERIRAGQGPDRLVRFDKLRFRRSRARPLLGQPPRSARPAPGLGGERLVVTGSDRRRRRTSGDPLR
ncbi:hypothetical protein [Streptomyces kanasensis]|uniref:Uncharacterized protein n=1 Tax=Streptomyces kanasensis TaxID=936756 RepID=A0A117IXG3_9ACTN|nr:hypothetical protein [Streptomyces kanasensis]KUH39682.1 hypothetical protein ATE80_06005 [Streptomyces kanasensis]